MAQILEAFWSSILACFSQILMSSWTHRKLAATGDIFMRPWLISTLSDSLILQPVPQYLLPPVLARSMLASVCRALCDKAEWAPCIKSSTSLWAGARSRWQVGPPVQLAVESMGLPARWLHSTVEAFTLPPLNVRFVCSVWQVGNWTTRQLSGFVEFTPLPFSPLSLFYWQ